MNENVDEKPGYVTGAESVQAEAEQAIASPSAFVGQVFWLVALMIGAAAAAGFLSRDFVIPGGFFWIILFGWMGLTFAVHAIKDRPGINVGAVLIHAAISGLIVSPLLQLYELESVLMAVVITGVASVGLGLFALTTRYDFSGLGGYVFGGLILLIIRLAAFVHPADSEPAHHDRRHRSIRLAADLRCSASAGSAEPDPGQPGRGGPVDLPRHSEPVPLHSPPDRHASLTRLG